MPHPLIERIEAVMKEASSISAAIGKDTGSHPSMYAMNRAWHSLAVARDGLKKPKNNHAPDIGADLQPRRG